MSVTSEIVNLYTLRGTAAYFGEPVSIVEHSLQAAHFAQRDGAGDALIVATLLHDRCHRAYGCG